MARTPFLSHDGGATAVEFALVLPLLLILMTGVVGVGWALTCASSVRESLELSARQLPLDPTIDQARLQAMVQSGLKGIGDQNVTVTLTQDSPAAGVIVAHASASYPFVIDLPFIPRYSGAYVARTDVPMTAS